MSTKRYQVFVSSTYRDLRRERERVLRTLAESNYIAAGMEYFPAIDEEQFKFITTIIDESDYYVTIIAGTYGSLAPDGVSFSEKEYEYALEKGLPVIGLIYDDIESLEAAKREIDPERILMLERFRSKVRTGRIVAHWKDEIELCLGLVNSLATTSRKYPREGWVRGGEDPEMQLRRILELEDKNKQLETQLTSLRDASVADHVRDQLARKDVQIRYTYVENDTPIEGSDSFNGLEIAQFVLPRTGFISRDQWVQVSESTFRAAIQEFISQRSKEPKIEISSEAVDEIGRLLSGFGLVTRSWNEFDKNRKFVTVATPGERLIREELKQLFPPSDQQERRVTAMGIMEDIAIWIAGLFFKPKKQ